MMAEKNLIPFNELTEGEQREIASKGGKASAKARRAKRDMKESLEILFSMAVKQGNVTDIDTIKDFASLKDENITVEQAMLIAQIQKALKGDTQALAFLRDTAGQKPVDRVEAQFERPTFIDDLKE